MRLNLMLVAILTSAPAIGHAEALDLVCQGTALHNESTQTFTSV